MALSGYHEQWKDLLKLESTICSKSFRLCRPQLAGCQRVVDAFGDRCHVVGRFRSRQFFRHVIGEQRSPCARPILSTIIGLDFSKITVAWGLMTEIWKSSVLKKCILPHPPKKGLAPAPRSGIRR